MSSIYIQEPPTNGKVLLKTSGGDIDIELWSKEAPKACRNFVQLCMEGYYDGTIFHRVVPEFIIQGGDPTGTGMGGESIYGGPFKDEFHTRLRFNRRGLVAMANGGPHDNGSQFFFTLGRADELNNKHTIFGKVTGDTVYNMLRLADVECDSNERPLNPHKIRSSEVLHSPFDDIEPRESKKAKKEKEKEEGKKSQSKATKNFSLLSFGEEAEEDEEMVNQASQSLKGKSKSSHDLLKDDPRLSSVPAVDKAEKTSGDEAKEDDEREKMSELVRAKLKKEKDSAAASELRVDEERGKKSSRSEELRKEVRQLKKELKALKQREDGPKPAMDEVKEESKKPTSEAVAEYLEERKKYEERRKDKRKKGYGREEQTMELLNRFKSKLTTAISEAPEVEEDEEELAEDDDTGWLGHVLQFDEQSRKVKDANMQDEDTFEIYDPRNPVNKRRREESKKIMKEKKAKR
ncbi:spliceosome-associated protein CWC27 homolog [Corythoichthys intestinalis]|uniref:spliceosome-associated protein CWC27 homolog n=1 Tax=Corythoichthys intestinalis TaxID=161448 RepID=UPI0025A521B0|nr:spliceosome-associated protein CWC27 homolog [Corythoichthys intestinalis]XP_061800257.1 spliceosome-associated protein CWC27 homolog [Nerophis lumbriciformis]